MEDEYPHKEIIVCDGASTDGTVELLKSYGDAVRWISEPDAGEYEARNKGLRMATGELFRYFSDDVISSPGTFAYASSYFASHPEVDVLFGHSDQYYASYGVEPVLLEPIRFQKDSVTLRNLIRQVTPVPASESAFFRRSVVDMLGPFSLTHANGDNEFWVRVAMAGLSIDVAERKFVSGEMQYMWGARHAAAMLIGNWRVARTYGTPFDVANVTVARVVPGFMRLAAREILHRLGIYPSRKRAMRRQRELASRYRNH